MYQIITNSSFKDAFHAIRPENFTYEGLDALFEHLEEFDHEGDGKGIELDVIALCCEFTEYQNLEEVLESYSNVEGLKTLEDLQDHTQVIECSNGHIIIADF